MMTRERLEQIKAKPHGPDVEALIAQVECSWSVIDALSGLGLYCKKCGFEILPEEVIAAIALNGGRFVAATGIPHSTIDG